ncbi:MAG: hypothetical protein QM691_03520 [Opitutaceae bacterium]
MPLRTAYVDFNSFFASVEQQERPELRGRVVGVAPLLAETTSLIAVSIEGKRRGLKMGLRVAEARRACPDLVVVESRPELYVRWHQKLVALIDTVLPVASVCSIDEVACALPVGGDTPEAARALGLKLKRVLREQAGERLTCSIGVAPNAFLAKVASDLEKPDGLQIIDTPELPARLLGLELRDLPGIGARMEAHLRGRGVATIAALYAQPRAVMRKLWGSVEGERMYDRLRGEVVTLPETQTSSIGHGHVLPPELRHEAGAHATLHRLLQKAAMRLRHAGLFAGGVHVALRFRNRARWSDALTFFETQDTVLFTRTMNALWARHPRAGDGEYLSVGVTLFHLLPAAARTAPLGIVDAGDARAPLHAAVDALNRKLGKNSVVFGGALGATQYAPVRIAFTRIPDLSLEAGGEEYAELKPSADELARFKRPEAE